MIYRYFLKKDSLAFREALTTAINNPDNYDYLIDYNMREMLALAANARQNRERQLQQHPLPPPQAGVAPQRRVGEGGEGSQRTEAA